MSRILLVEDDAGIREPLMEVLHREGFDVEAATCLEEARSKTGDIILLDWMLPDGQGIEYLRELRTAGNRTPVIFLTARTDLVDKVLGLEFGANDYVTKPFEPRELIARIRVQFRDLPDKNQEISLPPEDPNSIYVGKIRLCSMTHEAFFQNERVNLTRMEFGLLKLLMENPGKVFTRDELLSKIWGARYPSTRTVDNHILQLRNKFEPNYFETVHGVGYRFRVMENN